MRARERRERVKPHARARAAKRAAVTSGGDPRDPWAEDIVERVLAACHPKQRAFVLDPGRRVSALCARGAGKTTGGLARFVIRMVRTRKAKCLFIAQTKDDARELIWEKLQDWVERFGIEADFNEGRLTCTFKRTGSILKLVGADDDAEVNKLRGKPRHEVGIDETAVFPAKRLENLIQRAIGPRLGDYGGCLWMVSTPGHVLAGLYYEATRPGSELHRRWEDRDLPEYAGWSRWSSHAWSLQDAAPHVEAIARLWAEALVEKDANKWSDDNPIWLREYLGQWAADDTEAIFKYRAYTPDGTFWNRWDPLEGRKLDPASAIAAAIEKLPQDIGEFLFAVALDEGSKDPFAANVFAFSLDDVLRRIWHVFGFERRKMYARPVAQLLLGDDMSTDAPAGIYGVIGWPVASIADAGHNLIDELGNVYGLLFKQSDRSHKYKYSAIEVVNGDFIDGRLFILADSPLEKQLTTLQWTTDSFGGLKENKAQANHSTDTLIIGRTEIGTFITHSAPERPTDQKPPADEFGADPESAPAPPKRKAKKTPPRPAKPADDLAELDAIAAEGEFSGWIRDGRDDGWGNT